MINKLLYVFAVLFLLLSCTKSPQNEKPNVILVICDDMGYKDLSCYGQTMYTTPYIDKMAQEGIRFTDFYTAANVCSPSRASYITGLYPNHHNIPKVLFPGEERMLDQDLITLPELLQQNGYVTALTGKWHLGDHEGGMPWNHGFDAYFGIPYSNDMLEGRNDYPPLPLYKNKEVIETEPDQSNFTQRTTDFALDFIERNSQKPFFLMVTHIMPHVPLAVNESFKGKSGAGMYGDVIAEIDWSMQQIMQTLTQKGMAQNTLVIFTSDNGPWLSYGNHGGNPGVFREGKFTTFEGGHRVPFIVWGKGVVAQETNSSLLSATDVFPTIAAYTGSEFKHNVDGESFMNALKGKELERKKPIFYFKGTKLEAVRVGEWKYHTPHLYHSVTKYGNNGLNGKSENKQLEESLFNLVNDPGEHENRMERNPKAAKAFTGYFEK